MRSLARDKDELARLVVHDLKSPLASILANLRFVAAEPSLSSDAINALRDAQTSGQSMSRMVLNLLDVARSEDAELPVRKGSVSLPALLADVCSAAKYRLDERGQSIEVTATTLEPIDADADLLRRTIDNLLDNCMKYGGNGTRIRVEATPTA